MSNRDGGASSKREHVEGDGGMYGWSSDIMVGWWAAASVLLATTGMACMGLSHMRSDRMSLG
jgi:hypothetical protein